MSYANAYPCRCGKCLARKTLRKPPSHYVIKRYITCACGGQFRLDAYRKRKEHKATKCTCDGYHYPHRKGGGVWCKQHAVGPSDEDWEYRYRNSNI